MPLKGHSTRQSDGSGFRFYQNSPPNAAITGRVNAILRVSPELEIYFQGRIEEFLCIQRRQEIL